MQKEFEKEVLIVIETLDYGSYIDFIDIDQFTTDVTDEFLPEELTIWDKENKRKRKLIRWMVMRHCLKSLEEEVKKEYDKWRKESKPILLD